LIAALTKVTQSEIHIIDPVHNVESEVTVFEQKTSCVYKSRTSCRARFLMGDSKIFAIIGHAPICTSALPVNVFYGLMAFLFEFMAKSPGISGVRNGK